MSQVRRCFVPATVLATALLGGCGTPGTLSEAERQRVAAAPVLYVVHYRPKPRFATKPADNARARFPAVSGRAASGGWSVEHAEDPALRIKESLAAAMRTELNVAQVESLSLGPRDDAVPALRKRFVGGTVLDVRTLASGLKDGFVSYQVRVRIVDLEIPKILWIGACEWRPSGHVDRAPGLDDLHAAEGALLAAAMRHAADSCARSLVTALLASRHP